MFINKVSHHKIRVTEVISHQNNKHVKDTATDMPL